MGLGWVLGSTRYSPPGIPQSPPPWVHLPSTMPVVLMTSVLPRGHVPEVNSAVGLKSVGQLSLCARFSRFQGITEGYNLVYIGNPNDHKYIPGLE